PHIAGQGKTVPSGGCAAEDCRGAPFSRDGNCFAHTDPAERRRRLGRVRRGGKADFAQGVRFTQALLVELLEAGRRADGSVRLREADFSNATFAEPVDFSGTMFVGGATFAAAAFEAETEFIETKFVGRANFAGSRF